MGWKKIFGSPWFGVFGLGSFIWGIPGMLGDATEWRQWSGVMNPGWFYMAAGVGTVLFCLWLVIVIERHWVFLRTYANELAKLAVMVLGISLLCGLVYYLVFVHEPTETVWTHQTLSVAEQERAKAECEMKALEVGGSGFKIGSPRFEYETACLKSKGFALEEVKR